MRLFLCGDVMTGRGVDQILPHPGRPDLWEPVVSDARYYVTLAEAVNGPIPRPVDVSWPWGAALDILTDAAPDARVINLETSITHGEDAAPDKSVHYRMAPENIGCLAVARPDVCALANNHVLDFGLRGLDDTLGALAGAGIPAAGAGPDARRAQQPAAVPVEGGRVVVVSFGTTSSGIPRGWGATETGPGVDLLRDLSDATADGITGRLASRRSAGDVVVASVHWGSNWGYQVPADQIHFARRLIDGGVDIVHGHSSHHPRPIEVYRGKLILYGCGDLINDYEGIRGQERFRDDLRLLYLADIEPQTGRLADLRMVPMQTRRMRLEPASTEDGEFLRDTLEGASRPFGSRVTRDTGGDLRLRFDAHSVLPT